MTFVQWFEQYLRELKHTAENDRKFMERITRKSFVSAQPMTETQIKEQHAA